MQGELDRQCGLTCASVCAFKKRGSIAKSWRNFITETSRLGYFTITTDDCIARIPIRYRELSRWRFSRCNEPQRTDAPSATDKGNLFKLGVGFQTIGPLQILCTNAMTVLRHYALIYQANLISHIPRCPYRDGLWKQARMLSSLSYREFHTSHIRRRAAIPPYSALEKPPLGGPKLYPTTSTSLGFANLIRARPSSHGAVMVAAR